MTERAMMIPDEAVIFDQADTSRPSIPADTRTDNIILEQARPSPVLLRGSPGEQVHSEPRLSPGDLEILKRYSGGSFKEPPMGTHNPSECPQCKDNGNG